MTLIFSHGFSGILFCGDLNWNSPARSGSLLNNPARFAYTYVLGPQSRQSFERDLPKLLPYTKDMLPFSSPQTQLAPSYTSQEPCASFLLFPMTLLILSLKSLRGELSPFSAGKKLPRVGVNPSPPRSSHHPSKPHHKHHLQTDNKQIKHTTPMATACQSYFQSYNKKIAPFICLPREPPI